MRPSRRWSSSKEREARSPRTTCSAAPRGSPDALQADAVLVAPERRRAGNPVGAAEQRARDGAAAAGGGLPVAPAPVTSPAACTPGSPVRAGGVDEPRRHGPSAAAGQPARRRAPRRPPRARARPRTRVPSESSSASPRSRRDRRRPCAARRPLRGACAVSQAPARGPSTPASGRGAASITLTSTPSARAAAAASRPIRARRPRRPCGPPSSRASRSRIRHRTMSAAPGRADAGERPGNAGARGDQQRPVAEPVSVVQRHDTARRIERACGGAEPAARHAARGTSLRAEERLALIRAEQPLFGERRAVVRPHGLVADDRSSGRSSPAALSTSMQRWAASPPPTISSAHGASKSARHAQRTGNRRQSFRKGPGRPCQLPGPRSA